MDFGLIKPVLHDYSSMVYLGALWISRFRSGKIPVKARKATPVGNIFPSRQFYRHEYSRVPPVSVWTPKSIFIKVFGNMADIVCREW